MVTKRPARYKYHTQGSVLAKIFMVTKQCTNLLIVSFKFCSSKNPYGNKTDEVNANNQQVFCSSKNLYGNKTGMQNTMPIVGFCSSKNLYGNKTITLFEFNLQMFCSSKNPYGNKTYMHLL